MARSEPMGWMEELPTVLTRDEYLSELALSGQSRLAEADGEPAATLLVDHGGQAHTFIFQFDPNGDLWPGLREMLAAFRDAGRDEFDIGAWFLSPQGSADGGTPALILPTVPERAARAARSTIVAS